ncbi:helix-turn-helix transcriptional regulator [Nocardioides sp. NPDC051685]|uniref:helix-turn-helix transcriptional regulator n=1 Tax=Nocardioides sp. NPDC051685 TaxID=3364334 RepID=UPI0037B7B063
METNTTPVTPSRHIDRHADETAQMGAVVTLSELAAQLHVNVQTLYDLRSQGRGPRGFRVGRQLRFRLAEVEEWLARLEHADAERHPGDRAGGKR